MHVEVWWHLQVMGTLKHCTCKINPLDCQRSSREDRRCLMLASFTTTGALYVHMHHLHPLCALHAHLCPQRRWDSKSLLLYVQTLVSCLRTPFHPLVPFIVFTCSCCTLLTYFHLLSPLHLFATIPTPVLRCGDNTKHCSSMLTPWTFGAVVVRTDGSRCLHLFSPTFALVLTQGWRGH